MPRFNLKRSIIQGPYWLKNGKVELKEGAMIVLPLLDKSQEPIKEVMVMFRPRKSEREGEFALVWDGSPIFIPAGAALALKVGDVKFVTIQMFQEKEPEQSYTVL